MSTRKKAVTKTQAEKVLKAAAAYLGTKGLGVITPCGKCESCKAGLKYDWQCDNPKIGPAPTGEEAANNGEGPMLRMDWDWPGEPTPTLLLEGGPYDWAIEIGGDKNFDAACKAAGVWTEPYAGYALCIYRAV